MEIPVSCERLTIAILGAFLLSHVLTPFVRDMAKRRSLLDMPNHRSSHTVPIPRLGGAAIVPATLVGATVLVQDADWRVALLAVGALIVAAAGFFDDLKSITPVQKYAPQLVAAALGAYATQPELSVDLSFVEFDIGGWRAILLTAFWITAFINAFNFMDGIDGLAGGVGALTAAGLVLLTSAHSLFLLLPLAAALGGFLGWNISPASIFMGDGGSQFVGYTLAVGAIWWPAFDVSVVPVLLVFAPFLFDTGFTLLWRLWKRLSVFHAHRTHLYQRMTAVGHTHRDVSHLYFAATALSVIFAASYSVAGSAGKVGVLVAAVVFALAYVVRITQSELSPGTGTARSSTKRDGAIGEPSPVRDKSNLRKEAASK